MRGVALSLLAVIAQAHAKDAVGNLVHSLVDDIFDRALNANQINTDLDNATLLKGAASGSAPTASKPAEGNAQMSQLKRDFGIGRTIANGKYLLCDGPLRSTSGRSLIYDGYRSDKNGFPTGDKLKVKVSNDFESTSRENRNYKKIAFGPGAGRFVDRIDFLTEMNAEPPSYAFNSQCGLIMEAGRQNLKTVLAERGGRGLEGKALREAAAAAAQCIQAMHSSGLVWSDLKSENFVVVGEEIGDRGSLPVKGIDIESAVRKGTKLVSYSPEACPPEFARMCFSGLRKNFREYNIDYSFDIWSYGMFLYEIAVGQKYFGRASPEQIIRELVSEGFVLDKYKMNEVQNGQLRNLIEGCLSINPRNRPGIAQVLLHPYFLSTGLGPFGFR